MSKLTNNLTQSVQNEVVAESLSNAKPVIDEKIYSMSRSGLLECAQNIKNSGFSNQAIWSILKSSGSAFACCYIKSINNNQVTNTKTSADEINDIVEKFENTVLLKELGDELIYRTAGYGYGALKLKSYDIVSDLISNLDEKLKDFMSGNEIKGDFTLINSKIKSLLKNHDYLFDRLMDSESYLLRFIDSRDSYILKYASSRLKDNKDIVLKAVEKDGSAIFHASPRLQNDKNVFLTALKNYMSLGYQRREFLLNIIIEDPSVLSKYDIKSNFLKLLPVFYDSNFKFEIDHNFKVSNLPESIVKEKLLTGGQVSEIADYEKYDDDILKNFCALLEKRQYKNIHYGRKEFSQIAWQALKEDKISYKQFATAMLYESISRDYDSSEFQVVSIYKEDGSLDTKALDAILQTLFVPYNFKLGISESKIAQWLELMKNCPESEKCFFSIPRNINLFPIKPSIIDAISNALGLNTFINYKDLNGEDRVIVPSFSMKQNFLNVLSPDYAITITPKIGLSTLEEIEENGASSTRDEAIPFFGIDLPKEADTLEADKAWKFNLHDFYHAQIDSCIPDKFRKKMIELEKKLAESSESIVSQITDYYSKELAKKFIDKIRESVIDMEYTSFHKNMLEGLNQTESHWMINMLLSTVTNFLIINIKINPLEFSENFDLEKDLIEKFTEMLIEELKQISPIVIDSEMIKDIKEKAKDFIPFKLPAIFLETLESKINTIKN